MPLSVDGISGRHAKLNILAGIRRQLVDFQDEFVQTDSNVRKLAAYIALREAGSQVQDGNRYGHRAGEALTVGISNALQKLFSSVDKKTGKVLNMVRQMDGVLRTVQNRPGQTIEVHFDRDYAPALGNFTKQEILRQVRPLFVKATVADLLLRAPWNDNQGYIVGILAPFEGDEISPEMAQFRYQKAEMDAIRRLPAERWDRTAMRTAAASYMRQCVQMMRLYFDPDLLYAWGITMGSIVTAINTRVSPTGKIATVIASSGVQAIVDIFPGNLSTRSVSQESGESLYLGNQVPFLLPNMHVQGLDKITGMSVVEVDLATLVSVAKPSEYYISHSGRDLIIADIAEATNGQVRLTWEDLEKRCILVTADEIDPVTDIVLGHTGDMRIIYSLAWDPDTPYKPPLPSQLTELFVSRLLGKERDNLWVCMLDHVAIFTHSIDIPLILRALEFSGCRVVATVESETLVGAPGDIYVQCAENPKDAMTRHAEPSVESFSFLSLQAKEMIQAKAARMNSTVEAILAAPAQLELARVFKYCYAILSCMKTSASKSIYQVSDHVQTHPLLQVLRFPFVDKDKTTCNDWNTTNIMYGSVIARNNYALEIYGMYSSQNADKRHIEIFTDYVFEYGAPAGTGYYGSKEHHVGLVTAISQERAETQLIDISRNQPPEPASSLAVSFITGMQPEGVAVGDISQRQRTVNTFRTKLQERRYRIARIYGQGQSSEIGANLRGDDREEDRDVAFAVQMRLLEIDPYLSIPTFTIAGKVITPKYPEFFPLGQGMGKHSIPSILSQISTGVGQIAERLRNTASVETKRDPQVSLTGDWTPIVELYEYIKSLADVPIYRGAF